MSFGIRANPEGNEDPELGYPMTDNIVFQGHVLLKKKKPAAIASPLAAENTVTGIDGIHPLIANRVSKQTPTPTPKPTPTTTPTPTPTPKMKPAESFDFHALHEIVQKIHDQHTNALVMPAMDDQHSWKEVQITIPTGDPRTSTMTNDMFADLDEPRPIANTLSPYLYSNSYGSDDLLASVIDTSQENLEYANPSSYLRGEVTPPPVDWNNIVVNPADVVSELGFVSKKESLLLRETHFSL